MPAKPSPERTTVDLHGLVTPSTAEAFALWAASRGLTTSKAVRALVIEALVRELQGAPVGALYSELPPETAARIVALLRERHRP
jgi:hypothetical protein